MSKSLLLIEDDPFWRKFCTVKFRESAKLPLICVTDIESAWLVIKKDKPAAIILDTILPGEDGFSFLEKIKKNKKYAAIPVIVFSSLASEADVRKCLKLGAAGFFNKKKLDRFDTLIEAVKKQFC